MAVTNTSVSIGITVQTFAEEGTYRLLLLCVCSVELSLQTFCTFSRIVSSVCPSRGGGISGNCSRRRALSACTWWSAWSPARHALTLIRAHWVTRPPRTAELDTHVCIRSARFASNNSRNAGRICMKLDIAGWGFCWNLSAQFSSDRNRTTVTASLHEHVRNAFYIWILDSHSGDYE